MRQKNYQRLPKAMLKQICAPFTDLVLQCAIYNNFTLETAKQKLDSLQQDAYDAELSRVLTSALAEKGLSANVRHQGTRLSIQVHRAVGTASTITRFPDSSANISRPYY